MAWLGIICGLPLASIGVMAVGLGWLEHPYVRVGVAVVVLAVIPAVLADRLLPKDPADRKPGLVRDVIAVCWAGAALAIVALSGSLTGDALRSEALRLDEQGWTKAAYLSRWMAGPAPAVETTEPSESTDPTVVATESATPSTAKPEDATKVEPTAATTTGGEQATGGETGTGTGTEPTGESGGSDETKQPEDDTKQPEAEREFTPAELFSTYAPAVVSIKIELFGHHGGGTGFFIDTIGTIATNAHVVEDASAVRIKLFDGTEISRVELLAIDREVDLALLRIDPTALTEAPKPTVLGDSEAVQVGEPVSVIGNPLGLDHTLTNGIVSARRVYEGERYIQMSAPISPGNSGGPVFDRHGSVIGISVAGMVGGQNLNLAVPVSQLKAMISTEYPNRRGFGTSSW